MEEKLDKAVSDPRVHTQLLPYQISINDQFRISRELEEGLKKLGHKVVTEKYWAAVQAIYNDYMEKKIHAKSDPRKGEEPAGY